MIRTTTRVGKVLERSLLISPRKIMASRLQVVGGAPTSRRTIFYLGGDAHIYAAPVQSDYIFQRPPAHVIEMSTSTAAAATTTTTTSAASSYNATMMQEQPSSGGRGGGATAAAVSSGAIVTSVGGTYANYVSTEFAPWEDILLDMTAWMIAICLCYDPTSSEEEKAEQDKDDEDEQWEKNMQEDARRRFGRNKDTKQQQVVEENEETEQPQRKKKDSNQN